MRSMFNFVCVIMILAAVMVGVWCCLGGGVRANQSESASPAIGERMVFSSLLLTPNNSMWHEDAPIILDSL